MRTILYLIIAIIGNAFGTALMSNSSLGMTAWGSSASNVGSFFHLSIGLGFIILSVLFYGLSCIIRKKIYVIEMIESTIFLLSFSYLADVFINLLPSFTSYHMGYRVLINIGGMLILLFSIAVHIRLHRFVHPMDIFLYTIQQKLKSISKGTYLAYFIGFSIAIVFGLLDGEIKDIGFGTLMTLLSSGLVMKYYNKWILDKWKFD